MTVPHEPPIRLGYVDLTPKRPGRRRHLLLSIARKLLARPTRGVRRRRSIATSSARITACAFIVTACSSNAGFDVGHPWLDGDGGPVAISHEGVLDDQERITIDGFVQARSFGFEHMETDLRQVTSGELVAVHDVGGNVEQLALGDLDDVVPTARELLEHPALAGVRWNFELKGGDVETATALTAVLADTASADRVCVSFGITVQVAQIRDMLPDGICMCATLLERSLDWDAFTFFAPAQQLDERVVCTQMASEPLPGSQLLQVGRSDVQRAHSRGLAVHVYDVLGVDTDTDDVERWIDIGVDGIITDDHEAVREVFVARGLWSDDD